MAKTVVNKYGSLVIGCCPNCPEKISVYMKRGEAYKNARCVYCGTRIHGDGISGVIRCGHHGNDTKTPEEKDLPAAHDNNGSSTVKNSLQEIIEYDEHSQKGSWKRHGMLRRLPHLLMKKAKKHAGS